MMMTTMQRPIGLPRNQRPTMSPRPRVKNASYLQFDDPYSGTGRGEQSSWSHLLKKYSIHAIPVIVLLCFFILWWFFYPVNLEIKDGRIIAVHPIEVPQPLNNTSFDLAILAVSTSLDVPSPQKLAVSTLPNVQISPKLGVSTSLDVPIPLKLAASTAPDAPNPQKLAASTSPDVPNPQKLAASTSPGVPIPQILSVSTSLDVPIPQILALNNETDGEAVMSQSG